MSTPAFKVIALDMDGTLLTSDHRISPATREALQQARDQGSVVILVVITSYSIHYTKLYDKHLYSFMHIYVTREV